MVLLCPEAQALGSWQGHCPTTRAQANEGALIISSMH